MTENINIIYGCSKWFSTSTAKDIKTPNYRPFVRGNRPRADSPHKWPGPCIITAIWRYNHFSKWQRKGHFMMTSSNGNISRVAGLCEGDPLVTGDFLSQRPVTRSLGVFFDLRLKNRLGTQSSRWLDTPSCSLWRHVMTSLRFLFGRWHHSRVLA